MWEAIHQRAFVDRMRYPVRCLSGDSHVCVLVHPVTDDFDLKALLPQCVVDAINGDAVIQLSMHENGESNVMLFSREQTGGGGPIFLTSEQAVELSRQLSVAANRLKTGTIKVSFVPTESSRSSP